MKRRLNRTLTAALAGLAILAAGVFLGTRLPRAGAPPAAAEADVPATAAEAALERYIAEIDLKAVPFEDAVEALRKAANAPLVVKWTVLDREDPSLRKEPVTLQAHGTTLALALDAVIRQVQEGSDLLCYAPAGEAVILSTGSDLSVGMPLVRAYDVHDLLPPPQPAGSSAAGPAGGPLTSPGADTLDQVIQQGVDSGSWRDNGGTVGRTWFVGGRLIVVQTSQNHRQIAALLSRLRRADPAALSRPTPDAKVWDERLRRFVSADPGSAEAALRRRVPEVRLEGLPLEGALAALGEQAHANLVVESAAAQQAAGPEPVRVSLHLRDVTLADAIAAVLQSARVADVVVYGPQWDRIVFTSRQAAERIAVTRVYDVRPWLESVLRDEPPTGPHLRTSFGHGSTPWWPAQQVSEDLEELITSSVDPATWRANGGEPGWLGVLNGLLIVTQTWETQEKVADFLSALRADPARLRAALTTRPAPTTGPAPATAPAGGGQRGRDR